MLAAIEHSIIVHSACRKCAIMNETETAIALLKSEVASIRTTQANLGENVHIKQKKEYNRLAKQISYKMAKIHKIETEDAWASIDKYASCSCPNKPLNDLKTLVSASINSIKKVIEEDVYESEATKIAKANVVDANRLNKKVLASEKLVIYRKLLKYDIVDLAKIVLHLKNPKGIKRVKRLHANALRGK